MITASPALIRLPGAAMNNINKSLKPCGRLDMIVWRKREDNPWLHDAELREKEIVSVVSLEETDQVHCGKGTVFHVRPRHGKRNSQNHEFSSDHF